MATLKLLFHIALLLALSSSTSARSDQPVNSRKLDDSTPPEFENKCGGCPCNNPCNIPTSSPPPPSPPPPPPSLPPPPPPSPAKPPPSNYCPPPPAPSGGGSGQFPTNPPYIFINGPPQDLYPIDSSFSGAGRIISTGLIPFLIRWVVGMMIIALLW